MGLSTHMLGKEVMCCWHYILYRASQRSVTVRCEAYV